MEPERASSVPVLVSVIPLPIMLVPDPPVLLRIPSLRKVPPEGLPPLLLIEASVMKAKLPPASLSKVAPMRGPGRSRSCSRPGWRAGVVDGALVEELLVAHLIADGHSAQCLGRARRRHLAAGPGRKPADSHCAGAGQRPAGKRQAARNDGC